MYLYLLAKIQKKKIHPYKDGWIDFYIGFDYSQLPALLFGDSISPTFKPQYLNNLV